MKQDTWMHSTTRAEYGVTGALGSPRAWLRRALDAASLDDTTFQPGSITPTEISVAGIWYRPLVGNSLPVTGPHRELFRWFDIPKPELMNRPRTRVPLQPAIGVAAAVPMHEVMHWLKVYREAGAEYTWWNAPKDSSQRAAGDRPKRRQLDHSAVYAMLEQGMRPCDIAKKMDFPPPNIDYVAKKWRAGVAIESRRPFLDVEKILADKRAGVPVRELARLYDSTPSYIYRILGQVQDGQTTT